MSIRADSINIELNNRTILKDVSLNINQGEIISVIGPNGAGKSTLLKSLAGDIKPSEGNIYYDQKNIMAIDIQERAFTRSVMSQLQQVAFDFSVKDIIEMGWVDRGESVYADEFENAVMEVVTKCGVIDLIAVSYTHLTLPTSVTV